jgi:hypothetical protein
MPWGIFPANMEDLHGTEDDHFHEKVSQICRDALATGLILAGTVMPLRRNGLPRSKIKAGRCCRKPDHPYSQRINGWRESDADAG